MDQVCLVYCYRNEKRIQELHVHIMGAYEHADGDFDSSLCKAYLVHI